LTYVWTLKNKKNEETDKKQGMNARKTERQTEGKSEEEMNKRLSKQRNGVGTVECEERRGTK
jgi:hypothetical protein